MKIVIICGIKGSLKDAPSYTVFLNLGSNPHNIAESPYSGSHTNFESTRKNARYASLFHSVEIVRIELF